MSKQIEEVMALVKAYAAMQGIEPYDKQIDAHDAIEAKLRELLPVWQPIESVPKEGVFLVLGGQWHGEISDPSPSDIAIVSYDGGQFSEVGGDYYSSWINNPTHWMPLPKAPE